MISPVLPLGRMWRGRGAVRQTLLKLGKTIVNSRRGPLLVGSVAAGFQLLWICPLCWFAHGAGVLRGFSFHWKLRLGNCRFPSSFICKRFISVLNLSRISSAAVQWANCPGSRCRRPGVSRRNPRGFEDSLIFGIWHEPSKLGFLSGVGGCWECLDNADRSRVLTCPAACHQRPIRMFGLQFCRALTVSLDRCQIHPGWC